MNKISSELKFIILPFLTGYNNTKKVYKKWSLQPTEHYTDLRKQIVLRCYHETDTLREAIKFQDKVVHMWNPDSTKATSFIIPPVSLRDEIRTNGNDRNSLFIRTVGTQCIRRWR